MLLKTLMICWDYTPGSDYQVWVFDSAQGNTERAANAAAQALAQSYRNDGAHVEILSGFLSEADTYQPAEASPDESSDLLGRYRVGC